jgi:hypothetical protein
MWPSIKQLPVEVLVLLHGVQDFDVAYFGPQPKGSSGLAVETGKSRWLLPQLVRIRLQFEQGDRRAWPELLIKPMITIDSLVCAQCRLRSLSGPAMNIKDIFNSDMETIGRLDPAGAVVVARRVARARAATLARAAGEASASSSSIGTSTAPTSRERDRVRNRSISTAHTSRELDQRDHRIVDVARVHS